jgi:glucosamine--fructose-6-phosphate aminotransferase (isomerizing)
MLKEIFEQPEVIRTGLAHYVSEAAASGAAIALPAALQTAWEQIQILACGTSRHAGLVAQYWLEQLAGIPTRVRSASEFVAAPLPHLPKTLTIAITQSGETADTLAAVQLERDRQSSRLLGITNQPQSSLTQQVDHTLLTLAGAEVGVAATKTFTAQLLVLGCLALEFAAQRSRLSSTELTQLLTGLRSLPEQMALTLERLHPVIQRLAPTLAAAQHCVVLGRGVNRAIALEGALKLKETTYIHAEGYPANEFLHGPIALLDAKIPVIVIASSGQTNDPVLTVVQKVKQTGATVIGLTTNASTAQCFDHALVLPAIDERLSPFLTVLPLQLLAYNVAIARGLNVDRPRNITKTLT